MLNRFLFPPWSNVGDPPVTFLDFSEDDGDAILIILRVIHLQLARIPKSIDLQTAYAVAQICEQYDCLYLISPWVDLWLAALQGSEGNLLTEHAKEKMAYVCWAIGKLEIFQSLAMEMVKATCISQQKALDNNGIVNVLPLFGLSREILPDGLYGSFNFLNHNVVSTDTH